MMEVPTHDSLGEQSPWAQREEEWALTHGGTACVRCCWKHR